MLWYWQKGVYHLQTNKLEGGGGRELKDKVNKWIGRDICWHLSLLNLIIETLFLICFTFEEERKEEKECMITT